jgi:hypothetical protein
VIASPVLAPQEEGARGRAARACARRPFRRTLVLLFYVSVARAADVSVVAAPWFMSIGTLHLAQGAGTDFLSPIASDVFIAQLAISNTGGANWSLRIAREGNESQWPPGVSVSLRRGGGSAEAGISDGLTYRTLTSDLQPFFSGTGDYASVEILVRLDGVTVHTPPGFFSLAIRYAVEAP